MAAYVKMGGIIFGMISAIVMSAVSLFNSGREVQTIRDDVKVVTAAELEDRESIKKQWETIGTMDRRTAWIEGALGNVANHLGVETPPPPKK